jgi:four helix bundle protein
MVYCARLTAIEDYGLGDQFRKAVVSIPSNIAEGDELNTDRQSIQFFYIAKGSSEEVLAKAIIAHEIGYLLDKDFEHIKEECTAISSMMTKLIQARKRIIPN